MAGFENKKKLGQVVYFINQRAYFKATDATKCFYRVKKNLLSYVQYLPKEMWYYQSEHFHISVTV